MENQIKLSDVPRKQRNFPTLELTDQTTLELTVNPNQPLLVVQSPKTPTLSRKLKAASLDSDPPKQGTHLEVDRDVFSMPNTPKRQVKPKLLCDLDDPSHKFTLTPSFSSNLMRFGSNTSISGSQTLKTLPEVMPLQDFSDNRCEPIRIKAKGLLERRGSNASLTIDLGSNSNIAEVKIPVARLNPAKSVNNLNLTSFGNDRCNCSTKKCDPPPPTDKKPAFDRRKSQQLIEKCDNCTIYESEPKNANICNIECQTFNKKCACLCNYKSRRKSLSNENLYVPPCCNICKGDANKDCSGLSKGHRRACYPRQADLEASQLLSEDFKFYLQNVQYLQTAGNVLSVEELRECCETNKIPKIHQEFWEVPLNLQEKCLVPGSQNRNRYRGVLPNEHSRVQLSTPDSYIHANYIKGPDYSENAYIATQGPMPHTCEDFWDMVWMSKSNCIVMLTGLIEKGRTKCELYFPLGKKSPAHQKSYFAVKTTRLQDRFTFEKRNTQQFDEETVEFEELNEVRFGKYTVMFVAMETVGECSIRRLKLRRNDRDETTERLIYHYWFPNWQDHKMANPEEVLRIALHVVALIDDNYRRYGVEKCSDDSGESLGNNKEFFESKVGENNENRDFNQNERSSYCKTSIRSEVGSNSRLEFNKSDSAESRVQKQGSQSGEFQTFFRDFCEVRNSTESNVTISGQFENYEDAKETKQIPEDSKKEDPNLTEACGFKTFFRDFCEARKSEDYGTSVVFGSPKSSGFQTFFQDTRDFTKTTKTISQATQNSARSQESQINNFNNERQKMKAVRSHGNPKKTEPRKVEPVRRVSSNPLTAITLNTSAARMVVLDKLGQTRVLRDDLTLSAVSRDNVLDTKKSHDDEAPYIVVHCSAGIGRTGCFLAILNGIQQLKTNGNVDVLAILCSLRLHRGGMVQTAEQYELIHKVLKLYIDSL